MSDNQKYIIDGKDYGILRIVFASMISIFFAILSIDQLFGNSNKSVYLGIVFSIGFVSSLFVSIQLIIRYFFFKVCINDSDFYIRTNPFNAKTYNYSEVRNARFELKSSRASGIRGPSQPSYFYYFYFDDNNGETHKFQFEKSIYEKEINVLKNMINNN